MQPQPAMPCIPCAHNTPVPCLCYQLAEYDDGGASDEDDEKYAEGVDMPGTKVDSKQRITVRNLRIREDTAKYLRNLALESAYYDPKTRSMRENPYEATGKQE